MSLSTLIRKGGLAKIANDNPAKAANDGLARSEPLARLATLSLAPPQSPEVAPLPDPVAEARRQRGLAMLRDNPTITYAAVTDATSDPEAVIVALAIRGRASCELLVPREKWDGMLFIDLLDKHFGTVH
jgi:hypothetical protein